MRSSLVIMLGCAVLGAMGCQSNQEKNTGPYSSDPSKLLEIYNDSRQEGSAQTLAQMADTFEMKQGFSSMPNYYPVIIPPQSARIWIPTLVNREDETLIPGHPIFLKVYDDQWGIDNEEIKTGHHFSNLRKVKLPQVNEKDLSKAYRDSTSFSGGSDREKVYSVPVKKGKK